MDRTTIELVLRGASIRGGSVAVIAGREFVTDDWGGSLERGPSREWNEPFDRERVYDWLDPACGVSDERREDVVELTASFREVLLRRGPDDAWERFSFDAEVISAHLLERSLLVLEEDGRWLSWPLSNDEQPSEGTLPTGIEAADAFDEHVFALARTSVWQRTLDGRWSEWLSLPVPPRHARARFELISVVGADEVLLGGSGAEAVRVRAGAIVDEWALPGGRITAVGASEGRALVGTSAGTIFELLPGRRHEVRGELSLPIGSLAVLGDSLFGTAGQRADRTRIPLPRTKGLSRLSSNASGRWDDLGLAEAVVAHAGMVWAVGPHELRRLDGQRSTACAFR